MKTRSHLPRSLRRVQRYRNDRTFFGNESPGHVPFFSAGSSDSKRQAKGDRPFAKAFEEVESLQAKGEEEAAVQQKCGCDCDSKSPEDEESKQGISEPQGSNAPSSANKQKSNDCDEARTTLINSARSSAKSLAARAVGASTFVKTFGGIDLSTGPSAAEQHYTRWFGEHTPRRAAFVANSFTRIAKALNGKIHFDCGCKKDIYAYVYSGGRNKIHLCKKFWSKAGSTGFDSKPGVIIHELAHEVRSSIGDKGYGTSVAEGLAKKSPSKAIRNADNYEYYAESL
jgi:hypothetical protein